MYFKEQRYEKAKALTLASTYTKQLPESGLLDSMSLYFRITNASGVAGDAPCNMHHHITKIEVIGDSDKTLFSLTGEEAIAKAYRRMGALPPFKQNEYGSKSQDLLIPVFFGRQFKDGVYGLDLSKWDKVEVQITNDFSSTYFGSTSLNVDVRLCTLEDGPASLAKFIKQWEYQKDTPSAAGEYTRPKLPTSGLLRSLMIQLDPTLTASTAAVASDPAGDSYNWKLWFKDRSLTIIDSRPRDIMRDEHRRLGVGNSSCKPYPSTTRYTDFHWAEVLAAAISHIKENGADVTVSSLADSRDRYQALAFAGGSTFYQALIQGVGLFHTFEIPFYLPSDIESNYLNLDSYKPVEIEWYSAAAGNTHRLVLEKPITQGPAGYA